LGYEEAGPYDRIIVTAAAPALPKALLNQLDIGGKLIIPLGVEEQSMMRYTKTGINSFDKEKFGRFRFVPLLKSKN
jgi:protein-L-isoaspartate(D-aspartate) O-methyltransferase